VSVRVCHVITCLELGGAQENTLHTVRHLRAPFQAGLLAGPGGMLDDEARDTVAIEFVPALVRPIRPWLDLAAIADLARRFRRLAPDIVHTHSSKAGILGRLAARAAGVPIVVHSIHGFGFNRTQPPLLRGALVAAERLVAPLTTHFIAVSRAHLAEGAALGVVAPERATLIRSGVHLHEFAAAGADRGSARAALLTALGLPEAAPLVGMVACLKPQKAPLDFVAVAARVAAGRPEAHFVMVGDGVLRGAVEGAAAAAGIAGRLHLLGWRRDVPRLMAAFDVVALTSLWEGLPRVVPEAIAAGRPIVATAVDGTAEILRDGDNALLAEAGDIDGLAARIGSLLDHPARGRALVERARPLVAEFDIDAMVRSQEALYGRLLERRPARLPRIGLRAA
jgi:glycosyltransferase involved in cell wall biosynthesis